MRPLDYLGIAAWVVGGAPIAWWFAVEAAKEYRPGTLDLSPGLTFFLAWFMAPFLAPCVVIYWIQRPVTRAAQRRAGRRVLMRVTDTTTTRGSASA